MAAHTFLLGLSQCCSPPENVFPPLHTCYRSSPSFLLCYLPVGSLTQASIILKKGYSFSSCPVKWSLVTLCWVSWLRNNLFHVCKSAFIGGSVESDLWTPGSGVGNCKHSGEEGVQFAWSRAFEKGSSWKEIWRTERVQVLESLLSWWIRQ